MNHDQMQAIADKNKLGKIHFQMNIARNTSKLFEVGYVFVGGEQLLFCKYDRFEGKFKLCNDFCKLG